MLVVNTPLLNVTVYPNPSTWRAFKIYILESALIGISVKIVPTGTRIGAPGGGGLVVVNKLFLAVTIQTCPGGATTFTVSPNWPLVKVVALFRHEQGSEILTSQEVTLIELAAEGRQAGSVGVGESMAYKNTDPEIGILAVFKTACVPLIVKLPFGTVPIMEPIVYG